MSKHRAGDKFSSSHTTVIEKAKKPIDAAAKLPSVSKIVLGLIEQRPCKNPRLKFEEIPAGWKITVYSLRSIQTLYVYTTDKVATRWAMQQAFT